MRTYVYTRVCYTQEQCVGLSRIHSFSFSKKDLHAYMWMWVQWWDKDLLIYFPFRKRRPFFRSWLNSDSHEVGVQQEFAPDIITPDKKALQDSVRQGPFFM